ncbi:MAG: ComF family protein [Chitinophagaceae bacterium]|nr:ComF family protein [Chitinophagaceae bacterium]
MIQDYWQAFRRFLFPHYCWCCGADHISDEQLLCGICLQQLPATGFLDIPENPVERVFYGRLRLQQAGALYYYTPAGPVHDLITAVKYRRNPQAGLFLGCLLGHALKHSNRFHDLDLLVPLPLNARKEKQRGYNQATLICKGISQVLGIPLREKAVSRVQFTGSQTRHNRLARWQNMENVFRVNDAALVSNKHVLLVDDVITTGATMEACGAVLLEVPGLRLSIVSVAFTG